MGRRRVVSRALRWTLWIVAAVLVGGAILSQTPVMRAIVLPRLQAELRCDVTCGSVRMSPGGTIVVNDIEMRVPGVSGPEGMFLRAPSLRIRLSWWGLLTGGGGGAHEITLIEPVVRLSMGADQQLNVAPLAKERKPGGRMPNVTVVRGTLELGEHGQEGAKEYQVLDSMRLAGSLIQKAPASPVYLLSLMELKDVESSTGKLERDSPGMRVTGEIDSDRLAGKVALRDVNLSEWGRKTAPTPVRELWKTLAISGSIPRAEMSYDPDAGPSAEFALDGVTMNIPVPERVDKVGAQVPAGLLAMRGVTGTIRFDTGLGGGLSAELEGSVEELPCKVVLKMAELSADSALECRIIADRFKLVDRPDLLPLAPHIVRVLVQLFSSPTAEVNARVSVARGPPTSEGPAEFSVSGLVEFEKGRGEFELFTYPMTDVSGTITFNDKEVEITRIVAKSPTTAKLLASGRIWPPKDIAAVDVMVNVVDIPLDELFEQSLPANRRRVFAEVFDREAYKRLVSEGVVARSGEGGTGGGEGKKAFELGGLASMTIHVTSEMGENTGFETDIVLRAPKAMVLPKHWPYPCEARNVTVHATDTYTEFDAPELVGLSGATGSARGRVTYQGDWYDPDIRVQCAGVPIDPYLLFALPTSAVPASEGSLTAGDLVRRLGFRGQVEGEATVGSLVGGGIGYTIEARTEGSGLVAEPGAVERDDGTREGGFPLTGISGVMRLTESGLRLEEVKGTIGGGAAGATGRFEMELAASAPAIDASTPPIPEEMKDKLSARIRFEDLDLTLPIEKLVGAVAPAQGARLAFLRASRRPTGLIDGSVAVSRTKEGDGYDYTAGLTRIRGLSIDALGGRLMMGDAEGSVALTFASAEFEDVRARLLYEGEAAGELELHGRLALQENGASDLDAQLTGTRIESKFIRAAVGAFEPRAALLLDEMKVVGVVDAGITMRGSGMGVMGGGGGTRLGSAGTEMRVWIEPSSAAFMSRGTEVRFDEMTGRLLIDPTSVRAERLRGRAASWGFEADGQVKRAPGQSSVPRGAELTVSLDGEGLTEDFRSILPVEVDESLRAMALTMGGRFALEGGRLTLDSIDGSAGFAFVGEASFEKVGLTTAAPVTGLSGRASIDVTKGPSDRKPRVNVALRADEFNVFGVRMTEGQASIRGGGGDGDSYLIPMIRARTHDGVMTARGSITTDGSNAKWYDVSVDLSGIAFGSLLKDFASDEPVSGEVEDRGVLDGSIAMNGKIGDAASRRGRGLLRVSGSGDVVKLPLMLPLLELSNLQPPFGEPLNFASARVHIEGDRAVFDEIAVESDSLAIVGEGEARLSDSSLDLRFRTRAGRRIPILTDILETLRDEVVTTRVTGTLAQPEVKAEGLTATRKMLGDIFRGEKREENTGEGARVE